MQYIEKETNNIITEELAVNNDVLSACKDVENYLINYLYIDKPKSIFDSIEIREKHFAMTLFDEPLTVNFSITNYNFFNEKQLKEYIRKEIVDTESTSSLIRNSETNRNTGFCDITFISLIYKPINKFYKDLRKLLNHLYKENKIK